MTLVEFLDALRETVPLFRWWIWHGRIRALLKDGKVPGSIGSAGGCCPIEAIYFHRQDDFVSFDRARRYLGIPDGLFEDILHGADRAPFGPSSKELRKRMLDVLNLHRGS